MNFVYLISIVAGFTLVFAVVFYRISRNHPKVGGPIYWAIAALLESSTVLIAARPEIAPEIALVLVIFLAITGIGFNWLGMSAYLDMPVRLRFLLGLSVCATLVQAILVAAEAPVSYTMTVFFFGTFLIMALGLQTQRKAAAEGKKFSFKALNIAMTVEALSCFVAMVAIWIALPDTPASAYRNDWYFALLLFYSIDTLVRSAIYFLLVGKRLQSGFDQAEQLVQERQVRFTDLMENLSAGVLVFTQKLAVVDANKAGRELLAFAGDSHSAWQWIEKKGRSLAVSDGSSTGSNGKRVIFHELLCEVRSADGLQQRWILATAYDQTSISTLSPDKVLTFLDITAQKAVQERQVALEADLARSQRMRSLGQLASGIAHDFNNSLLGISGWVTLAKEDLAPEHPALEALDQALKGGRYAQGLVRQLLAFSRQEKPKLQWVDLADVVGLSCEFVTSGLVRTTRVSWNSDLQEDMVLADPTQLQQVLVNLLINASHAMNGEGHVHIEIRSHETVHGGDLQLPGSKDLAPGVYRHLSIRDNGPGIAPENLNRIFEPFFSTKRADKGTGLGLSVAHGVMTDHKGAIAVESTLGQGACFHLYLPTAPRKDATPSNFGNLGDLPTTLRVLIVTDDDKVIESLEKEMKRLSWHPAIARNAGDAWGFFETNFDEWDVVLIDQYLPDSEGVALADRMLKTEHHPPVILITDHGSLIRSSSTGISMVLERPIQASELVDAVAKIAQRHQTLKTLNALNAVKPPF